MSKITATDTEKLNEDIDFLSKLQKKFWDSHNEKGELTGAGKKDIYKNIQRLKKISNAANFSFRRFVYNSGNIKCDNFDTNINRLIWHISDASRQKNYHSLNRGHNVARKHPDGTAFLYNKPLQKQNENRGVTKTHNPPALQR